MSERKSILDWNNLESSVNFNFDMFDMSGRNISKIKEESISQGAIMYSNYQEDPYPHYQHFNIENTINFSDLERKNFHQGQSPQILPKDRHYQHDSGDISFQAPSQNLSKKGLKSLASLLLRILLRNQFSSHKDVASEIETLLTKNTCRNKVILQQAKESLKEAKNIKRRIYDALNVMISAGILSRQFQKISLKHHSQLNSRNYSIVSRKNQCYERLSAMKQQIQMKRQLLLQLQEKRKGLQSWKLKKTRLKEDEQTKLPFPLIFVFNQQNESLLLELQDEQLIMKSNNMDIYSQSDIFQQINKVLIKENNDKTAIKIQEYIQIQYA